MIFKVRHAMNSDPVVVDAEISVTETAHRMIQTGQDNLIVIDGGNIIGIVDTRKVLRYTYTEGFRPNQTPVSEITNSEIVLARSNTSLEDVLTIMIELKQDTLPVVDDELMGSINLYELLKTQKQTKLPEQIPLLP